MYEQLYADNHRLIRRIAHRYGYACSRNAAVDADDLLQSGFIGLVQAQATFDPNAGKSWAGWAGWYIENAMRDALGLRAKRIETVSLDAPASDDPEGVSLGDLQPDTATADPLETLLQDERTQAVRAAVDALPEGPRAAVTLTKLQCLQRDQAAAALGIAPDQLRRDLQKGMRLLQKNRRLLDLETDFYAHKGIRAFRIDHTSTVEAAVIRRERLRESYPAAQL